MPKRRKVQEIPEIDQSLELHMRTINNVFADIGQAMQIIARVGNQGRRPDNESAIGQISLSLRAAAYRLIFGNVTGFTDEELLVAAYRRGRARGIDAELLVERIEPKTKASIQSD